MSKKVSLNFSDNKYVTFLISLYQRNKLVLAISAGIFLSFLCLGILFGYFSSNFVENILKKYLKLLRGTIVEITTF